MAYWLIKGEPGSYGWAELVRDGGTEWDGIRNATAAKHLAAMQVGDLLLFYHSGEAREAVGIARVTRGGRPDAEDGRWTSVAIEPVAALAQPVTLKAMKAEPALAGMAMLRQSRPSVSPVSEAEWAIIRAMAGEGA